MIDHLLIRHYVVPLTSLNIVWKLVCSRSWSIASPKSIDTLHKPGSRQVATPSGVTWNYHGTTLLYKRQNVSRLSMCKDVSRRTFRCGRRDKTRCQPLGPDICVTINRFGFTNAGHPASDCRRLRYSFTADTVCLIHAYWQLQLIALLMILLS